MLGILLGIAIVVLFVFYGSGDTIDAPSIDDNPPADSRTQPERER